MTHFSIFRAIFCLLLVGCISSPIVAPAVSMAMPSMESILATCRERLPQEPLQMAGTLTMRKAYGVELKKLAYQVALDWGAVPSHAEYTICDLQQNLLEALVVERQPGQPLTWHRRADSPQATEPMPPLNATLFGTDITWLDITLDFLWWQQPHYYNMEKVKGRLCWILEVKPPTPLPGCHAVRLWIDCEQHMILQAIQYDEKNRETRKMWVRAIQKVSGRWVLKDIEVETLGTGHRTRLHVDTVHILSETTL